MISVEEQEVHMMSNEIVWYGGYVFVTGARVMGSSTPSLRILIFTKKKRKQLICIPRNSNLLPTDYSPDVLNALLSENSVLFRMCLVELWLI
jgi:hypothetical protein